MKVSKAVERLKKESTTGKITRDPDLPEDYYDKHVRAAIRELNRAGVSMMAVPEVNRKRALILEKEFTQAANQGDTERFRKLLKEWRNCFH